MTWRLGGPLAAPLVLLTLVLFATPAAAQERPKLDPRLAHRLQAAPGERVPVLVRVRPMAAAALRVPDPTAPMARPERHRLAVQALRTNAQAAQAPLLAALAAGEPRGEVRAVEPFWIANLVRAEVTPDVLAELERRPDVERIYLDRRVALAEPPGSSLGGGLTLAGQASAALAAVGVEQVWDLGFTGKGILVANLDSGVQGDHPALADKWRGLRAPVEQAWFDPYRNSTFPVDDDRPANGHGTATMGILVGGERSFGVVFDAEWIAANVFENNQSFISTILKGLEWATDPDGDPTTLFDVPDVINASFGLTEVDSTGVPTDTGLCDDVFDQAVDAAAATGAIVVFSAGNFSRVDPGDITAPGSSLNAFAVGAVDNLGNIADFSGQGPSLCEGPNQTKPNLVAPGRSVRTLNRNAGEQNLSGTSFSTPIAGGVAALVRQKNPTLAATEVTGILLATARDLGPAGPDNTFGSGLVDALAAVNATPASGPVLRLTGFVRDPLAGSGSKIVNAGAPANDGFFLVSGDNPIRLRLTNPTATAAPAGPAQLASRTPLVEVVDGSADLPALAAGGEAEAAFVVRLAGTTPAGADLGLVLTPPVGTAIPFTAVAGAPVEGTFATHDANEIRMTVTNFGAIGFWLGVADAQLSQNELLGEGFHFPAEDETNYLFHASFLVGRSPQQVSDDLPYGNVAQSVNDFHTLPGASFGVLEPGPIAAQEVVGAYDDSYNFDGELGVSVRQHSYAFTEEDRTDFVIVTYDVTNRGGAPLTNLHLGLFADWDFVDASGDPRETMDFASDLRLGIVEGAAGTPALGIVALNAVALSEISYRIVPLVDFQPPGGGSEIREEDKFAFLSGGVPVSRVTTPQDLAHLIGFGPRTLAPGDSLQAAFAFVAGESVSALRGAAGRARTTYEVAILGREPPPGGVPNGVVLAPPFPNPLRRGESVTLGFGIPAGELGLFAVRPVTLRVLDVRGNVVRTLVEGEIAPGNYTQEWDGRDAEGREVPSGVYVVVVESGSGRQLKKLVLVR